MKIDLKLPERGEMHFERQPMSKERFYAICALIATAICTRGIIEFFKLMT